VLVLLRLAAGTWGVARLARRGVRVDDGAWLTLAQRMAARLGVRRPLTLMSGAGLRVPVTWGILYPVILLPDDAGAWPDERRRYVLVHEMAHVKRLDALTQLVAQVAVALFWVNPLTWLAARRMRVEREHACDDYVVLGAGVPPSTYAGDLLDMVRALGGPGHRAARPAFAALAMARRTEFEGRMLAILDAAQDRHPLSRRGTLMLTAAVLALALPLAAFQPTPTRTTTTTTVVRAGTGGRVSTRVTTDGDPGVAGAGAPRSAQVDGRRCDTVDVSRTAGSTSSHIHVDDYGDMLRALEFLVTTDGRCAEAVVTGDVGFSPDEREVVRVGSGAVALFRERTAAADRAVRFTGAPDGVRADVTLDGRPAAYDAAARAWVGEIGPELLREAAVRAPARVARARARGGTDAVLALIARTRSTNAKRAHYEALLASEGLSEADAERTVRHASRALAGSASDLRAVLQTVPRRARRSSGVRSALGDGLTAIGSDGDRSALLVQYVASEDREMVLAGLRGVAAVTSDGDKAAVLVTAAAHALRPNDPELRAAFFDALATVRSDGDASAVLVTAIPHAHAAPPVTAAVLRAVGQVRSDGDAAAVLVTVAGQRLITTRALRDQYLAAARGVESDGDYRRVIAALLAQEPRIREM
jgi:hypothetical protein